MALAQAYVDAKIKPTVKVTEEDAREYYISHPQDFQVPEQIHARHILIEVPEGADEATEEAARKEAELVHERVTTGGEDFATVAREHSDDRNTAAEGGDLGKFSADQMVKPFSDAAFALEPGEISDVVRTKFGYHIIEVEEKRPARMTPFEEVRDTLMSALQMRSASEAIGAEIERLRDRATIENLIDLPGEAITTPGPAPEGS